MLHRLVRHARQNVFFYEILYRNVSSNFTIEQLPITQKRDFVSSPPEEYLDNSRGIGDHWHQTSGTSGEPFSFLQRIHILNNPYANFLILRFLFWRGMSSKDVASLKIARIRIRGDSRKNRLLIPVREFLEKPDKSVKDLLEFNPELIEGYPSMLILLSSALKKYGLEGRFRCRYVVSFGEVLTPSMRKFISESFQSEVYDRYGLEELGIIGVECSAHNGLHVHSESYIVEILDGEGCPVAPGQRGRVVVTDLYNYEMPFIRYDTGDYGNLSVGQCSCGLETPRLFVDGRYSSFLHFGERKIHHLEFDAELDGLHGAVLKYQVVKVADNRVRVLVVPGKFFETPVADEITKRMQRLLGSQINVSVEQVLSTLYTSAGKTKIVIDLTER